MHPVIMSENFIHASYDILIYILNLACQILPRPLNLDVLIVHKNRFTPILVLQNGELTDTSWTLDVA